MPPTFDQFMARYRGRIEEACKDDTYGDPTTDRDNKAPISVRAMNVVTQVNLEIFGEIAVFVDKERLVRLLQHVAGDDDESEDVPYRELFEAHTLLEQITTTGGPSNG